MVSYGKEQVDSLKFVPFMDQIRTGNAFSNKIKSDIIMISNRGDDPWLLFLFLC